MTGRPLSRSCTGAGLAVGQNLRTGQAEEGRAVMRFLLHWQDCLPKQDTEPVSRITLSA